MIEFLADTVAIIRHFAKAGRIGLKAKNIFKGADKLFIRYIKDENIQF